MILDMSLGTQSVGSYLSRVLGEVAPLRPLQLTLMDALGSVLAEDVYAEQALPHFDHATHDGFAAAHADIATATASSPIALAVLGNIKVDAWEPQRLPPGSCCAIVAGAPMPAGADIVIPREWTDGGLVTLLVQRAPRHEHGVLRSGAVIAKGALVGRKKQEVTPQFIGLAAQVGVAHVQARPRPRLITMGVGAQYVDSRGATPVGQIPDAASYVVTAAARQGGAHAFRVGALGDDPERIRSTLADNAMRADLLVVTGDISLITQIADDVELTELPVEPAGSIAFGRIGGENTPLLCLPGDPGTAFIWYELLVQPLLRRLLGCGQVFRRSVKATLAESVASPERVREFRPGILTERRGGGYVVRALDGGKTLTPNLAAANAIIALSDQVGTVPAGAILDVMPLQQVLPTQKLV